MRYIQWDLYKGTARAITGANRFVIYLKNQASSQTALRIYLFTAQKITPTNQTDARISLDVILEANQDWTKYEIALDLNTTYYGHGIFLSAASEVGWINVDGAMFVGPDNNSALNYYAKKDLVLNGTTSAGAATIKFAENGNLAFTCEGLGINNANYTYSMSMNEGSQELVIIADRVNVKGTYAVSASGVVTFTVTSVAGDLTSYLPVGTVFSNQ